jgi:hypothetical protein
LPDTQATAASSVQGSLNLPSTYILQA